MTGTEGGVLTVITSFSPTPSSGATSHHRSGSNSTQYHYCTQGNTLKGGENPLAYPKTSQPRTCGLPGVRTQKEIIVANMTIKVSVMIINDAC
ncbi:hypothetical protein AVEN_254074-1 [Araneus ventricosus]|uniref:Uncharacterized protein n=1 Tax=Araneus ventricosus TaxID=182803 RepID=A0A4Y2BYY7_ARAVE|nr:hypothetical protein AVEN_254074-1 [Araneus ventricosus]